MRASGGPCRRHLTRLPLFAFSRSCSTCPSGKTSSTAREASCPTSTSPPCAGGVAHHVALAPASSPLHFFFFFFIVFSAVVEAAKQANAHDFIMEFDENYETNVGEKGEQLSGGQVSDVERERRTACALWRHDAGPPAPCGDATLAWLIPLSFRACDSANAWRLPARCCGRMTFACSFWTRPLPLSTPRARRWCTTPWRSVSRLEGAAPLLASRPDALTLLPFRQPCFSRARHGRTTVVVAHRLSTIKSADIIAVIDKGHVVEQVCFGGNENGGGVAPPSGHHLFFGLAAFSNAVPPLTLLPALAHGRVRTTS